jgi:phospholipase C
VAVPNVSPWRLSTVGDLTATLRSKPDTSVPALPSPPVPAIQLTGSCSTVSQDTEQGGADPDVPTNQTMPTQQGTTVPPTRYDASMVSRPPAGSRSEVLTAAASRGGRRPMTIKSSYNRLAYTKD